MQNTNEKNKQNNQKKQEENKKCNLLEKKIIVYLITIAIILLYVAQFHIHDIIDRGVISDSQASSIVYPPNNNNNNNNNNGGNNQGGNNQGENNEGGNGGEEEPVIVDGKARIRVLEGQTNWKEIKELGIFSQRNFSHVTDGKIAPGVHDVYAYTVENYGDYTMSYNMTFIERNPYNINMIYKLKINGEYVSGTENKWVKFEELNQTNMIIKPGATDIYKLEWKWEDAENDTEVGETEGADYSVSIDVVATQI